MNQKLYCAKDPVILRQQAGFTLIELIVTLAIAAIVLTQGIPSFITTIQNNKISTTTNDLVGDINLARSEAISRGVTVTLCRSDNPQAGTSCGNSGAWNDGWLVYADDDNSGSFNAANDTLIRIGQPVSSSITLNASAGVTSLSYNSNGTTSSAATTVFAFCDTRGGSYGNELRVNTTGRPRLTAGNATTPITCSP